MNAFDPFNDAEDDGGNDSSFPSDARNSSFFRESNSQEGDDLGTSFDTSFDSSAFQFSASRENATLGLSNQTERASFAPEEIGECGEQHVVANDAINSGTEKDTTPVRILLHEEMSCSYDNLSKTASCSIEGIISIRPSSDMDNKTFYLALNDTREHIERLSFDAAFVEETNNPDDEQQEGCRVFAVNVPEYEEDEDDIQMVKYSCCSSLRPVPVLVQTKVRIAGKFCRVGIKIRANPSNKENLVNVVILLPVPPDMNGDTAKMSRRGTWDAMKRIITWTVSELQRGETVEAQSQFEFASGEKNPFSPKFPVLVRCDASRDQLSCVNVGLIDVNEDSVETYALELERSFRVLHHKL